MNLQELEKLGWKPGTFDVPNPAELVQHCSNILSEKRTQRTPRDRKL
jgi:hypothetical protein